VPRCYQLRNEVFKVQADKKWLTISEAARHIGMSVGFLRKAVRLRSVPHTRVGSKALRFDHEALDRWLEASGCDGEIAYRKHEGL
jgi:excisionase family DNA binding protein